VECMYFKGFRLKIIRSQQTC